MLPTGNEQVTSFSVDSEEYVRLQREKEELEKERSQLIQKIQSQNDELSKLTELLLSAQKNYKESYDKSVELEAVIKNIRQAAVATKEKLSTEIKMKEKEIESLKKSIWKHQKRLSLIDDRLQQVHVIEDTVSLNTSLQPSTSTLESHSAGKVNLATTRFQCGEFISSTDEIRKFMICYSMAIMEKQPIRFNSPVENNKSVL